MSEEPTIIETTAETTAIEETQPVQEEEKVRVEEFEISGERLKDKVKGWLQEANVRRISIKKDNGETLFEVPMTIGAAGVAVGVLLAPVWVAIAAIAALFVKVKVVVERVEE